MSCYCKAKVLRIPVTPSELGLENSDDYMDDFENKFGEIVGYFKPSKFMISCTHSLFLDLVIDYDGDTCEGDYGKVRELYASEKARFLPVFALILPNISMDKVRLVEFSWYNCSEAPDYYDVKDDPFYAEIGV